MKCFCGRRATFLAYGDKGPCAWMCWRCIHIYQMKSGGLMRFKTGVCLTILIGIAVWILMLLIIPQE